MKNLVIGVNTFDKLSCTQSPDEGLKPIVITISKVMNRKAQNPIKIFILAFSFPKYSDKISVHKNVDANKIVPNATGSGE